MTGYRMSDQSRSVFGNQYMKQNRCAVCLTEDNRNPQNVYVMCQHNTSVESALHYLRNHVAPMSPTYGSIPYNGPDNGSAQSAFSNSSSNNNGGILPNISPNNYYMMAELLLRMQQQKNSGGGHNYRPPPMSSRPSKPKSETGCLRECAFCKSNGETAEFYKSHFLKDPVGRVRCPILQRYQCPFCYATGENAHTRRYCPKNPNKMCFMKGGEKLVVKQNLK